MFIGAFELSASWSNEGVRGCRRFLERVWKLQDMVDNSNDGYSKELETKMHQTIKKVSTDYEAMKFNTAIAALRSLVNDFYKAGSLTRGEFKTLLVLLNPVASHMTEELWEIEGFEGRLYNTTWPEYDEAKTVEDTVEIAIQVNGKVKGTVKVGREEDEASVKAKAHEVQTVANFLEGKNIVKEIYVKGKIFNIVAK